MLELTKDNFEKEVIQSQEPVLVDFWAPWCGPCKIQEPIVLELAKECAEKTVKIAKLNIDENQELAARYRIVSIPTIAIFVGGEIKEQIVGVHAKDALAEMMEKYILL